MNLPWRKKTPSLNNLDIQIDEIDSQIVDINLDIIENQNYLKMLEQKKAYIVELKLKIQVNAPVETSLSNSNELASA